MRLEINKQSYVKTQRYKQDAKGAENLKERTWTYVTESCHSPTKYCEVYPSFYFITPFLIDATNPPFSIMLWINAGKGWVLKLAPVVRL